jgi:hypothetical protein
MSGDEQLAYKRGQFADDADSADEDERAEDA